MCVWITLTFEFSERTKHIAFLDDSGFCSVIRGYEQSNNVKPSFN